MNALQLVLDHFLATKAQLGGTAKLIGSADQLAVLELLPEFFRKAIASRGRSSEFKIEGSIGNGNIARVPWVGIFHQDITESAQDGYYIVLLFAEDMSGCYLSLNQGVTEMEKRFTRKLALAKMRQASLSACRLVDLHPEAHPGQIDLHSTGDLGRGYDAGAIASFYYARTSLPSESVLFEHLMALLSNYDYLRKHIGRDLQAIAPVTETEFQEAVYEKAASKDKLELAIEPSGGIERELVSVDGKVQKNRRSASIAALALRSAGFTCELDASHQSFISRWKKMPYVEAHHLIPLSSFEKFAYSLDVSANIVALCATCHRLLHYGTDEERAIPLMSLLERKLAGLHEKKIGVTASTLRKLYMTRSALED